MRMTPRAKQAHVKLVTLSVCDEAASRLQGHACMALFLPGACLSNDLALGLWSTSKDTS
jgi:hypothetical protein